MLFTVVEARNHVR